MHDEAAGEGVESLKAHELEDGAACAAEAEGSERACGRGPSRLDAGESCVEEGQDRSRRRIGQEHAALGFEVAEPATRRPSQDATRRRRSRGGGEE